MTKYQKFVWKFYTIKGILYRALYHLIYRLVRPEDWYKYQGYWICVNPKFTVEYSKFDTTEFTSVVIWDLFIGSVIFINQPFDKNNREHCAIVLHEIGHICHKHITQIRNLHWNKYTQGVITLCGEMEADSVPLRLGFGKDLAAVLRKYITILDPKYSTTIQNLQLRVNKLETV